MIEKLRQQLGTDIKIVDTNEKSRLFVKHNISAGEFALESQKLDIREQNQYIADDTDCHNFVAYNEIKTQIFADLDIQSGWCFGRGTKMNGVEWHKSSEVVVAITDCVLFLGDYNDIIDDIYDTKNTVALYLKVGEVVELMPMTLHLAPARVEDDFVVAIILPQNTNLPLVGGISGSKRAVNKWLLVHKENETGIKNGGKIGVIGKNLASIDN